MQESSQSITPQQCQLAAVAGVQLLDDKDLRIPMSLAMGQLGVLKSLLQAVAQGTLIFSVPPVAASGETPPMRPAGKLEALTGGKEIA